MKDTETRIITREINKKFIDKNILLVQMYAFFQVRMLLNNQWRFRQGVQHYKNKQSQEA